MVLNKLLQKTSRKPRLDTNSDKPPKSPSPSPQKRQSPASPSSSARNSEEKDKRPQQSPTKQSKRSSRQYDKDSHPLNLPPGPRRSALSAMSANSEQFHDANGDPMRSSSPTTQPSPPSTPSTNYANSPFVQEDRPPVPPHRVPTSPPPTSPSPLPNMAANAESFKTAGNNFFKTKNYTKAIEEYGKGTALSELKSRIF